MASKPATQGWGAGWPAPLPPSLPEPATPTLLRWLSRPWADVAGLLFGYLALAGISRAPYGCVTASGLLIGLAASLILPLSRRWWFRLIHARRARWRWMKASKAAVMRHYLGRPPAIYRVKKTPAGELLRVRVPVGSDVRDLEIAADVLAVVMQVREVRVTPVPENAALADVVVVRRDPLQQATARWPGFDLPKHSIWAAVPVGTDADGNTVRLHLPEHNVLLGGEPGAGKSVAMSLLVATAALDPCVQLHLFDGKLVELGVPGRCGVPRCRVPAARGREADPLRTFQLGDDELAALARRAERLRYGDAAPDRVAVEA